MPDDELEAILAGVLERTAGYLGVALPAAPPDARELGAWRALVELAAKAPQP